MPKNIVILCDGTSNEISEDRTNILRLFGTLEKNAEQIVYYDPGVGTFGAANHFSYYYRRGVEILGLATGWGLSINVKEAYQFLIDHYDDGYRDGKKVSEPDNIYLFGFSRGAYTARVLAGFIHVMGLLPKDNMNLLDYAYRAYTNIGKAADSDEDGKKGAFDEVRLFQRILKPSYPSIKLLGLFDTVSSMIEFNRYMKPQFKYHAYTTKNASVETVRHAVAINEKRTMFRPQLWPEGNPFHPNHDFTESSEVSRKGAKKQNVKEVWFTGVHGDIGGGYPEKSSGLAKIPLVWMINETKKFGLHFNTKTINEIVLAKPKNSKKTPPNHKAKMNVSMSTGWSLLEYFPRKKPEYGKTTRPTFAGLYLPQSEPRHIPIGATIHQSVLDRVSDVPGAKLPPNIPSDHKKCK